MNGLQTLCRLRDRLRLFFGSRWYIALVAVLERLRNKPSLPSDMVVSIAYNVGAARACERRSSRATTPRRTRRRFFCTMRW